MSDDLLQVIPAPAQDNNAEAAQQPSSEAQQPAPQDGTGASTVAETDAEKAERIVQERKARQERARRNQEAAMRRLAQERDEFKAALLDVTRKGLPAAQPQQVAQPKDGPPRREDFQTWEEYEDARVDWRVETKAREREEKLVQQLHHAQRAQQQQALMESHAQRNEQFAQQVPDFEEVTARDDIIVPDVAGEAIMSLPNGPEVLYAIGKMPQIAAHLHTLTPAQQAAFVGQLSASLMYRPPQVSKAPPPGTPVGGKATTAERLEDADYDTFVKIRRKQIAARR